MKAQLKDLITQYHPGVIWFDGGWISTAGPRKMERTWSATSIDSIRN